MPNYIMNPPAGGGLPVMSRPRSPAAGYAGRYATFRLRRPALTVRRRDAMIFWTSIMRSARTRRCSASSRRKPRSRNTLPVEGVILSFLDTLPSCQDSYAALADQGSKPLAGQFHVTGGRLPGALLERVQHIDGLREFGDVQHAVLQGRVNSNLTGTGPDGRHRLPIHGVQALLDTSQLNAGQFPGVPRESTHIVSRGTEPLERL